MNQPTQPLGLVCLVRLILFVVISDGGPVASCSFSVLIEEQASSREYVTNSKCKTPPLDPTTIREVDISRVQMVPVV